MRRLKTSFAHVFIVSYFFKWTCLVFPVSITIGSLVALFLWLLEKAVNFRFIYTWLLFLLPLAGILIYFLYKFSGKNVEARKEGIINAAAHSTHTSFTTDGKVITFSVEGDNSKPAMCVELVDKRERLEAFFLKHQDSLREKAVIFKEVKFWDVE